MEVEQTRELYGYSKERLAYMVAWRDRHIQALEEQLFGREEEHRMLQTLLFYALHSVAQPVGEDVREVAISKREVAELLGEWGCHTVDGGDNYLVRFTSRGKEEADDASCEAT